MPILTEFVERPCVISEPGKYLFSDDGVYTLDPLHQSSMYVGLCYALRRVVYSMEFIDCVKLNLL